MGFERVSLFAIIEFDYEAPAGAACVFRTDQPSGFLEQRGPTLALPASGLRRTVKFRLLGSLKGKKYQVIVTSEGRVILYGGRVYLRPLGMAGAQWGWESLPITPTANTFTEFKLPIDATGDKYSQFKLPIDPTGDKYSEIKLPIEPTGDKYTTLKLPIDGTDDKYTGIKIPLHPTPDLTDWIDIPVAK